MAVMPRLMANAPVRSGSVSDLILRSYAALGVDNSPGRLGPLLYGFNRGGSSALMPKDRVC